MALKLKLPVRGVLFKNKTFTENPIQIIRVKFQELYFSGEFPPSNFYLLDRAQVSLGHSSLCLNQRSEMSRRADIRLNLAAET